MKQNKITRGTLPPLFDRIVDDKSGAGIGNRLFNADELKESIIRELSLILNTRCTVRKVIYEDHIQTVPLFGLPDFFGLGDFSYFDGANPQEWPKAARLIETAIQAGEPRIQNVQVKIEHYDSIEQTLSVTVSAFVKESDLLKEIHFHLALHHRVSSSHKVAA